MKTLVVFTLLILLGACPVFSAGSGTPSGTSTTSLVTNSRVTSDDDDGDFDDFEVKVKPDHVGQTATYSLEFEINDIGYLALRVGLISFDFPEHTDLSNVRVADFKEDYKWADFHVISVNSSGTRLTLEVKKRSNKSGEGKKCISVEFEIELAGIVNSTVAGTYQLTGTASKPDGSILAGPTLSESFKLKRGALAGLAISPDDDMILQAGDSVAFQVYGVDRFGNEIREVEAEFSLTEDSDPIGHLTGATFHARTVGSGYVRAEAEGFSVTSGLITVTHSELAEIELNIETDQIVRIPLFGIVNAVLLDAYGNRVTDYDLSVNPLRLALLSGTGSFTPSVISDNSTFSDGLIDITLANVISSTRSLVTEMIVLSGSGNIVSNRAPITFSGYDIVEVLDSLGNPLTELVEGTNSLAKVVVVNNGPLVPIMDVVFTSRLISMPYSIETSFIGSSSGQVDTIEVSLPPSALFISNDTVLLILSSTFESAVSSTTLDNKRTIVDIIPQSYLIFDSGSFLPDSIYPGVEFNISFDLLNDVVSGPFDSTMMNISLKDNSGFGYDANIFSGRVTPTSFANGRISYSGLKGLIRTMQVLESGFYDVHLSFLLLANGQYYRLADPVVDSIYVHARTQLIYQANSLQPKTVPVDAPAVFSFTIDVESDLPLDLDVTQSTVTLNGNAFNSTVNIDPKILQLTPGSNEIKSQPIFIPPTQLGQDLTIEINIAYKQSPTAQTVIFNSDADGETIFVQDRSVLRINALETVAFNGVNVNTGQSFQIIAQIENLSSKPAYNINFVLSSDGYSQYEAVATVDSILPAAIAEIVWDVIASDQPTYAEVFTLRIDNQDIGQLPPLDNVTLAIIESPADLQLIYTLRGANDGLVDQQAHFIMTVEIANSGDAQIEQGEFLLTTGGVNFGTGDSIRGDIGIGDNVMYEFIAPPFDTTVKFQFAMTRIPIDRNTGKISRMDSSSFSFDIRVRLKASYIFAEAELVGTNLVTPGNPKPMYLLTIVNSSLSNSDNVELKEIIMGLHFDDNTRPDTEEIIRSSLSVFRRDGSNVFADFTSGDVLTARFENITIPAGLGIVLEFVPMIALQLDKPFSLTLEAEDIVLERTSSPQLGQRVPVSTPDGSRFLISQTYISRGETLLESFIIERNPFNPDEGPVSFGYRLDEPSAVRFQVYTLIGEEVFSIRIGVNDQGGQPGEHDVLWDGRNDDGKIVQTGVYIAILEVVETGEKAHLKVAVMR